MEDSYDGYLQLENGVGMIRLLDDRSERQAIKAASWRRPEGLRCTVATGALQRLLLHGLCGP